MAKKRELKKDIHYVVGELYSEVLVLRLFMPGIDLDKADALMRRIINMQEEFIKRVGRVDGKENKSLVREYYQKLRIDLQTEVDAIATGIGELGKEPAKA